MMIDIWNGEIPGYNPDIEDIAPTLDPYIMTGEEIRGAVLICPGGGYGLRADHEGRPVAEWLNSLGLSVFVLHYRVAPYHYPYPILDAKRAIRYIRYRSNEWNINTEKICVLGFSAGGHLASTIGTNFDYGDIDSKDPIERESCRPDAMVLSYPVISFSKYAHQGSINNLLGSNYDKNMIENLSSEKNVTQHTPATFIWHTANDESVPVENTLLFSSALSKHNVPFETHIFAEGKHGLGLAEEKADLAVWTKLCSNWFKNHGFI